MKFSRLSPCPEGVVVKPLRDGAELIADDLVVAIELKISVPSELNLTRFVEVTINGEIYAGKDLVMDRPSFHLVIGNCRIKSIQIGNHLYVGGAWLR